MPQQGPNRQVRFDDFQSVKLWESVKDYAMTQVRAGLVSEAEARVMVKAAGTLEGQLIRGLSPARKGQIVENPVLDYVNSRTRPTPQARNFSEVLTHYYENLRGEIEGVLSQVKNSGIDYLMTQSETGDFFSEEAAADVESLSAKFALAPDEVGEQLCFRSADYVKIEKSWERRFKATMEKLEMRDDARTQIPVWQKRRILNELRQVANAMSNGTPVALAANDLMLVTSDLLHYLDDNLGQRGLILLKSGKAGRPLESLNSFPVKQLEMMIDLLSAMVRDYEDCIVLHRDLLLGVK